jgi:uncharacterized protein (UPF0261 family)
VLAQQDRGAAVTLMSQAAPIVLGQLFSEGKIHGRAFARRRGRNRRSPLRGMRALPLGFPKVMVSTLASGNTAQYVGVKDIVMFPSVVDIAGLNRLSRQILSRAAGAICGMVEADPLAAEMAGDKPMIVA